MPTLRYRVVDVFSDRPLAGNALAVVLDPCPADRMAAVAREFNLSETTFPVVTGPDSYEMRIFTPGSELPFAGHPSLGTAWVLGPKRWSQTTAGATVTVEASEGGAVMTQPDPTIVPIDLPAVAEAAGLRSVVGTYEAKAAGNTFLVFAVDDDLAELEPDHGRLAGIVPPNVMGPCVVGRLDDRTLHVRVFVPSAGIPEDPGTGSAAGPIGVVARRQWGCGPDMTIRQGDEIGRPCRLLVHVERGDIRVGGQVAAFAEGTITV